MTLNRRQLLSHGAMALGGVTLSPLMNSVMAQIQERASGTNQRRLRFVFLLKSNGLWADNIQPQGFENRLPFSVEYDDDGRLVNGNHGGVRKRPTPQADVPLGENVQLNALMQPLQPFRDRLTIVQGINSGFPVYHKGQYQVLSAIPARRRDTAEVVGPTIDSVLANAFPAPVRHVLLGHDPQAASGVSYITSSAASRGQPLPFYTKPTRGYRELFGVVGQGAARAQYDVQSDILDFFAEDAQRIQQQTAAPEREQLNHYLNAFASLRQSRQEVEAISDRLRQYAPEPPGEINANAASTIGRANVDIAIAALASGLTNVVTISFDTLGNSSYPEFGIGGLHGAVGHGQGGRVLQKRQNICRHHFQQMARLATALQRIPEGEGTMLDNTVIVYTSTNGETHHSSGVNWPMVILGTLGGRLRSGRYYAPGNGNPEQNADNLVRLGDVWATLLEASGQPYRDFGQPRNGVAHRPIRALLSQS